MIQAMYNGVSGLRAHKTEMDVISNNIANINTVGFKSSRVNFREMLNQTIAGATAPKTGGAGGSNPLQIGLGVSIGSIDVSQTQGSLQATGKSTDVAIEGNGFLVLGDGQGMYYTRDGSFQLDAEGDLVSSASGLKVMGWSANLSTGQIDDTVPISAASSVKIPVGSLAVARATTNIMLGGNLNSSTPAGTPVVVSGQIYDSLGTGHSVSVSFSKNQLPVLSQGYADVDTTLVGAGSLDLKLGTDAPISVAVGSPGVTLQGLVDAINSATPNVSAKIVDDGPSLGTSRYKLSITSADGRQVEIAGTPGKVGTVPMMSAVTQSGSNYVSTSQTYASSAALVGTGTVVIQVGAGNPTQIAVSDPSTTLADLRDLINNASPGVTASIAGDGTPGNLYHLNLTGTNAYTVGSTLAQIGTPPAFASVQTSTNMWTWTATCPDAGAYAVETQSYASPNATVGSSGAVTLTVGSTSTTVSLSGSTSLQDLCSAINSANAGVKASVVNNGSTGSYKLVLTSGDGRAVSVSSSISGVNAPTFVDDTTTEVGRGTIGFDEYGQQSPPESGVLTVSLAAPNGANNPIVSELSFMPITQLADNNTSKSTVTPKSQDGLPLGVLNSFTIGKDGTISGEFTNGTSQILGRVALAQFSNSSGLSRTGNNMLTESSNSGVPQVGQPSIGSMGNLTAGFLESSNVDLPTEFANMIVAQRGFQANSRIITTSDEILQELVQLKR